MQKNNEIKFIFINILWKKFISIKETYNLDLILLYVHIPFSLVLFVERQSLFLVYVLACVKVTKVP